MAALTPTEITGRLPLGDRFIQFFSVASSAAAAADEYFLTGFGQIESVFVEPTRGTSAGVAATGTYTLSATDPTDEDTFTIDGIVYTLQAGALVVGKTDVALSGTEATQATNMAAAINGTGTPGTTHSLGIGAHPAVSAAAGATTVVVTARVKGAAGNSITIAESSTGLTVSGATLSGGIDPNGSAVNVVLNALGTGQSANSTMGALGIETSAAAQTVRLAVIGRA